MHSYFLHILWFGLPSRETIKYCVTRNRDSNFKLKKLFYFEEFKFLNNKKLFSFHVIYDFPVKKFLTNFLWHSQSALLIISNVFLMFLLFPSKKYFLFESRKSKAKLKLKMDCLRNKKKMGRAPIKSQVEKNRLIKLAFGEKILY